MKVIIQQPLQESGAVGQPRFVDSVFEVELRALDASAGWHVLRSFRKTDETPTAEMSYIHKGFFDCHLHMIWSGLFDVDLDFRKVDSWDIALAMVHQKFRDGAPFVRGYGWDESRWGMTLGSLERVAAAQLPEGKPVLLYRVCGHSALTNRTMRLAARKEHLGAMATDKDLRAIGDSLPLPDQRECEEAFLRAQKRAIENGITSVGDMSLDETNVAAIRTLAATGKLLLDVQGVFDSGRAPSVESQGPFAHENAGAVGPLDRAAVFAVRHWKKYLDGSLGSRTAWLTQPYEDIETFGESLQEDPKALIENAREALQNGFLLSFHAIGDAALDQALDVGEKLDRLMAARREDPSLPGSRMRHRLEHVQVVRDDQLARMARQGHWFAALQPHHRMADQPFVESRLGAKRCRSQAYRGASFLKAGIPFGLSSDSPVDSWRPLDVIRAAMTHDNPAERLSFSEALWWYTTGSRLESGLVPGRLGPGSTVFLTPQSLE